jgi:predicted metal-dependent hydrolase
MSQPEPLQLDLFGSAELPSWQVPKPARPPSFPLQQAEPQAPAPPPTAHPKRQVQVSNHCLDYTLRRSKRRSIGFLIDDDGLRITAPKWISVADIETAIREKQRWILTKLHEHREQSARRLKAPMQWSDGATLPYLGNPITLRLRATHSAGIAYDAHGRELTVSLPPGANEQQLKDRVQGWLQLEAKRLFGERLPLYADKLGVAYHSYALSSATTQWGSCTAQGKIRLNWRLIHFTLPLIDYVIAHELAHLREMNHGPRFWATVQSIFPEFETAKKSLREQAPKTLPIF